MIVIGKGLCRNAGVKNGQLVHGDYHHKVELTERDLLLLEMALNHFPLYGAVGTEDATDRIARRDHTAEILHHIHKMLTDY